LEASVMLAVNFISMIGQTIAHYEITAKLGQGGMGEVYRATDTKLNRGVALKVLSKDSVCEPQFMDRLQREAKVLALLNHPNIGAIYGLEESNGTHALVLELIEGSTLRDYLTQRTVSGEDVEKIAVQIAEALRAAHEKAVIHRDLKPSNIMISSGINVKILDFGLAKLVGKVAENADEAATIAEPLTESGETAGTLAYMSPEQANGERIGQSTDIFSFGLILYELMTGEHPFAADTPLAMLQGIVSREPLSPSVLNRSLSSKLDRLILQMLRKDPSLRPTIEQVQGWLTELAQDSQPRAVRPIAALPSRHTVGRGSHMARLRGLLDTAEAGQGSLVCVTGEPGIGKSTFVEGFLEILSNEGSTCIVGRGRCSERLAGTEAYLPLLEALEGLFKTEEGATVARAMRVLAPTWYVQVAPVSMRDSSFERVLTEAKAASQERMKRELTAFLVELCRIRPVILFFEDLHWVDISTVDLLSYIGDRCQTMRLLVLGTYRPGDLLLRKHPFATLKLELEARNVCHEISLNFLTRENVSEYLSLEFPKHRFPKQFEALIHDKTEGNPLFVVDLLRYLRVQDVIAHEAGGWSLVQPESEIESGLPQSVRSMIEKEIGQVSETDRRLLLAASVQGNEFDAVVVADALSLDVSEVEERLEFLDRVHGLVRSLEEHEFPDSTLTVRYSFVHVLYQNTLYSSLTPARRVDLSASVAKALLSRQGDNAASVASELAFLFESARDFERASDFFAQAAGNAAKVYANQEGVELSRRAIKCAEKLSGRERGTRTLATALQMARLNLALSRFDDAVGDFDLAEKSALEIGDVDSEIAAKCGAAMSLFNLKRLPEMLERGRRALDRARAANSSTGEASAELVIASERLCSGFLPEAEHYFDRAIPVLRQEGLAFEALEAICYRAMLHSWRSEYKDAERYYSWTMEKARELGSCFHIVAVLLFRGMSLGNQGRLAEAFSSLREGLNMAELNGDVYWLPRLPNTIAWLHREIQDLEPAMRLDTECVQIARETNFAEGEANAHGVRLSDYTKVTRGFAGAITSGCRPSGHSTGSLAATLKGRARKP
jgi:tRNA A-37 threonylcarbamoyl transferase component Bud32/tetratricopeptide (TPR) repeat protein